MTDLEAFIEKYHCNIAAVGLYWLSSSLTEHITNLDVK